MKALFHCIWPVLAIAAGSVMTAWVTVFAAPAASAWQVGEFVVLEEEMPVPRWGDACSQARAADCVHVKRGL